MPCFGAHFSGHLTILESGMETALRSTFMILMVLSTLSPDAMAQTLSNANVIQADDSADTGAANYLSAIEDAENELGAYNYALVEPAVDLGLHFQQKDQHAQAVDTLERALHVNRVNKGLHHLDHIPIVDLLVQSHLRLGDWQNAAQQQQLRFWIHKREIQGAGEDINEPALNRFVEAAIHYANWQSKAHRFDTGRFPLQQLRDAQNALNDARALMHSRNMLHDHQYLALLNTAAVNHYNMVVYLSSNEVDPVTGSYTGDQDISDYLLRQNIINENYQKGTAALRQVSELTASDTPNVRHAMAKLNYANWQLLFNRPQTARKEYAQAFTAFVASGVDREALNQAFAEPERIKAFTLKHSVSKRISQSAKTKPEDFADNEPYVVATFDVTRSGEVRNVDIEKSWPQDDRRIRLQTRARLASSKFRPALIDGKPVQKKDVEIRYVFPRTQKN